MTSRLLKHVGEAAEARRYVSNSLRLVKAAKKRSLRAVNEHDSPLLALRVALKRVSRKRFSEPAFNDASATQVVFQQPARRQRGFTLIEVLVAFVILAMALGVLTRILSLATHSLATAGHYQQALYLAESQLAEIGATLRARRREHLQGRLEPPYRWEAELEPYDFVSSQLNLEGRIQAMLIRVSVAWGDNPSQQVSLSTIRLVEEPL